MPEIQTPSREADIWEPTRTDAVVIAVGVVFVGGAALVTLILPDTPGWTFLANLGLSAGVAIALIGVLLRFQLRIESELKRLGEAIDEQAERTRRLEEQSGIPRPTRQYRSAQEHRSEATLSRRHEPVAHRPEATTETKGRWSSLTNTLQKWWKSAQRPYRPPKPPKPPRKPLFRLPEWLSRAIEMVLVSVGWLFVVAFRLGLVVVGVGFTFVISAAIWVALLSAVGLWHAPASNTIGDSGVVMMLAGLTTATLAGLATWGWADLRPPIAIAASTTTLVGLAVAQYAFGAFG